LGRWTSLHFACWHQFEPEWTWLVFSFCSIQFKREAEALSD
jgi:hypothetical protein